MQISYETAVKIAQDVKKTGKKLGFAHGAFDLFHKGHLYFLERSKAECDFLMIAVESDRNVSSYKSYQRPIFDESTRLDIVSSLCYVDYAFIFDLPVVEESYVQMYREIRPDFVSHGRDFGWDGIRKVTHDLDIELKRFLNPYMSTSDILSDILNRYGGNAGARNLKPRQNVTIDN